MNAQDPEPSSQPRYREPQSTQTLAEGLREFYAKPGLLDPSTMDAEAATLFRAHDAVHVLFGLTTSLRDEVLADAWTVLGTDMTLTEYMRYLKDPVAMQVIRDNGVLRAVGVMLLTLPEVVRVALRARKMKRRWEWRSVATNEGRSLAELRRELGVELVF